MYLGEFNITYTVFDFVVEATTSEAYTQTHLKWRAVERSGRNKYDENRFGVDTTHRTVYTYTLDWFEIRWKKKEIHGNFE